MRFPENIVTVNISEAELKARLARIQLLLMDVDGVLTDGRLLNVPGPHDEWVETKAFDSQDGLSLRWLEESGIECGVISGRVSPAVEIRAQQLGIKYVVQGQLEKIPHLERIAAEAGIALDRTAYIGDDFTDVVVMRRVGVAIAVANARPEVKQSAHYVTRAAGGAGAVREAAEMILMAQGRWSDILKKYEID